MSNISLSFEQDGKVARITFDNAPRRNALTRSMWRSLPGLLQQACEARVLLVCGQGAHFSAGADIHELGQLQGNANEAAKFRLEMQHALTKLANFAAPSIAEIRGSCYGAGLAIAMACDLRFADASTRICIPPAKLGLLYPKDDLHRLVSLVGLAKARQLLFTGQVLDASSAYQIGLINEVGNPQTLISDILRQSSTSLSELKSILNRTHSDPDHAFDDAFSGADFAEGLAAFAEKRQPDYC